MPSFLYVGADGRDFPSDDGLTPSFSVEPGDTIEADENPNEAWFDLVDGSDKPQPAAGTAGTITEADDPPVTEEP